MGQNRNAHPLAGLALARIIASPVFLYHVKSMGPVGGLGFTMGASTIVLALFLTSPASVLAAATIGGTLILFGIIMGIRHHQQEQALLAHASPSANCNTTFKTNDYERKRTPPNLECNKQPVVASAPFMEDLRY